MSERSYIRWRQKMVARSEGDKVILVHPALGECHEFFVCTAKSRLRNPGPSAHSLEDFVCNC